MLIVGEKEQEDNAVSVRRHGEGDLGSMPVDDFISLFQSKVAEMLNK